MVSYKITSFNKKKKSLEVSWVVPRNEATFDSILKYSVIRVTDVVN